MGVRSNDHQLVAGKQYFDANTQFEQVTGAEGILYGSSGALTSGSTFNSGALTVPGNSVITDLGCVVKTACVAASGNWGVRFGTTANGVDIAALVAANLEGSQVGVAAGIGTCMHTVLLTALQGAALVVMDAGDAYIATDTDIHGSVLPAGDSITAGEIVFWVRYIQLG